MTALEGVTPFPPEFVARYRVAGFWEDKSIAQFFDEICTRFSERTALIAGIERITYQQLAERVERLALHLLKLGLRPLDRFVLQLPNIPEFVYLYLALQKIGVIPVMALVAQRYNEIQHFVKLSEAVGYAIPERIGDFPFVELAAKVQQKHPTLRWIFVAGQTVEPEWIPLDDPDELRYETADRPVSSGDELRLVDDHGNDVPDGQVGELLVRGPYTLRGYFRVPEYNARTFTPEGFYRSGDLMRRHPSGNYIVEGRKKDLINRGGEKISAEEIENLILSHPAVLNVACVPMPDPQLGERMCAFVMLQPGMSLTLAELTGFLIEKGIAKFKLPERLEIVSELPLSKVGKVLKQALIEQAKTFTPTSM